MGKIDATLRQPQLSSNIIAFLTAICVVLLGVWTGVLDIDSYDLMLSLPVMESFRTPELFSRQDLLIESGRVIPFYVYRALSYFSSFGIRIEDLITYGFIVTHAAALYVFWWISLYFVQSRVVASLSAIIIGISIPDSLCFNWTYFPTRCFVSASAALPFLCLSILFILRERFWLASLAATVTALAHPGLGMISLALVSAGIVGTKQASFSTKGVRLLGVGAGALILLFAVGSHVAQNKSDLVDSKLVWKIFTVFSEHSLIEFHWPDRYIEYLLANTTLFIVLLYMPEIPRRKATSLLLCSYILIGVYGLNLYLLGDFTLVQTFLFRASLITKLLGIPILLW